MTSERESTLAFDIARSEDVPQLTELLGLLLTQEADFTPDPERQRRALNAIVGNASIGRIYLVRDGAEVIAMASLLGVSATSVGRYRSHSRKTPDVVS